MTKSKKKIETLQVEFKTQNNFTFVDLITHSKTNVTYPVKGKDVTLRILSNKAGVIVGIVETSRNNNIPPKKNRKSKTIGKLGLTEEEGLVYANIFIYEVKRRILLYEVNKFGCYVDHFVSFIYRCFRRDETFSSFDIKLKPVLKSQEYQRMINMRFHKSLEIRVANPEQILKEYKHKNDALWNLFSIGRMTNSSTIFTKFAVSANGHTSGLTSSSLTSIVDRGLELVRGPSSSNIKKIVVEGYEFDSDDNKLSVIDLIADRYLKYITLEEPRENIDLLEHQRSLKIKELYENSLSDFDAIFGKK